MSDRYEEALHDYRNAVTLAASAYAAVAECEGQFERARHALAMARNIAEKRGREEAGAADALRDAVLGS